MSEPEPLLLPIANTFGSGPYAETLTTEPTVLFRAHGGTANQIGVNWTTGQPAVPIQSIVDSALRPAWGNPTTLLVKIEVPPGVTLCQGKNCGSRRISGRRKSSAFPKNMSLLILLG